MSGATAGDPRKRGESQPERAEERPEHGEIPPERGEERTRGPDHAGDLAAARTRIEALDDQILALIADRVRAARAVGRAKRRAGAGALDPGREAAVVRRAVERGRGLGLPDEPVRDIFWAVIGLCRGVQLEDRP